MRPLRSLLPLALVTLAAAPARADVDLVVLGPAKTGAATDAHVAHVAAALAAAKLAPPVSRKIEGTCVGDPGCLTATGTELGARRLLAVGVADAGGDHVSVTVSYVDVIGKELVALRDLSLTDREMSRELAPALAKFIAEAPTDRAKVLFAEGNMHFNLGELDQALELYKRAYRIKPLPAFLFNIAQCHRKLGHAQDAITMYQAYLTGVPDAPNRAVVESLITESKAALVEQQKEAQAKAQLAAQEEHDRLATEEQRAVEMRKAKEAEALAAVERSKAEQARLLRDREDAARYDHHTARKVTIATGALATVALVVGGVYAVRERSAQSDYDSAGCGDPTRLLGAGALASCESDNRKGKHDASLANVFLIGGGAGLALSGIVFALDPGNVERPERGSARVAVMPGAVRLEVTF